MLWEPPVVGPRRPVHAPLDQAVEGLAVLAGAVALPPVGLVQCDLQQKEFRFLLLILVFQLNYLVMEVVVDGDFCACLFVDPGCKNTLCVVSNGRSG